MIDEIVGGLDVAQRWGVAEGQLALASKMINSQVINRIVREYIDGRDRCGGGCCRDERRTRLDRVRRRGRGDLPAAPVRKPGEAG